ncbi:MAG: TauD/TfdA dioxygenase family protein [Pseudomonadales bacterium]
MTDIPKNWTVTRLAGALGAEIRGPQLAKATEADIEHIKSLLLEHLVIFFPGQEIAVAEHIDFGRRLGDLAGGHLEGHPNLVSDSNLPPEIFELKASGGGVADEWHTDLTFQEQPAIMSILRMVTCPTAGGDTMWTSLYAAYDELSEPMQALCEGLTALHDALPHNRPDKTMIHPVVRVHPETGRKALYVNEHFTRRIVELNAPESEALLSHLTKWVGNPRFTVRYNWSPGTIGIWDNRCTQHFVLNDFEGERVIQRVTVVGDQVQGAEAPRWQPWVNPGRRAASSRHDRQLYMHLKESGQLS